MLGAGSFRARQGQFWPQHTNFYVGAQSVNGFRQAKRCLETGLFGRTKANFGISIVVLVRGRSVNGFRQAKRCLETGLFGRVKANFGL